MKTKNMLRQKLLLVSAFVLTVLLIACSILFDAAKKANAAVVRTEIFTEDFDGKDWGEEWTDPVNAELCVSEYSMRYNSDSGQWGSTIALMPHKITGSTEIMFDMEAKGGGWIAFVFGMPHYTNTIEYGDTGTWFFSAETRLMDDGKGTYGGPKDFTMDDYKTYGVSPFLISGKTTMHYVLTENGRTRQHDNAKLYDLDLYMYKKGEQEPAQPNVRYTDVELEGYYGFSSMGSVQMTVVDFTVKENDQTVFEDDFTDSAFMFDNDSAPGQKWSVTKIEQSALSVGPLSDVQIVTGEADGSIASVHKIVRDARVHKQFTFSVQATLGEISPDTLFGLSLNDGKVFVGLEKTGEKSYRAAAVKEGAPIETTNSATLSSDSFTMTFEGYSDGKIVLTADTAKFEFSVDDFSGTVKLGTHRLAETSVSAGKVAFDNASLHTYAYDSAYDAKDMSINFKGVRTYEESGETLYEYYVNRNDWLMQGVKSPMYSTTQERNYVQFSDGNWNKLFGPKQRYSEFVCRFTVTVTDDNATPETAIIFSFARQNYPDAAVDYPYIVFTKKRHGMEVAGGAGIGGAATLNDVSFWNNRDANNNYIPYDVMLIVAEGKIEVYFASSNADAAQKSVLRAAFTHEDTKGYIALAGHNGASFRINGFSVTNIALNGTGSKQNLIASDSAQTHGDAILLTDGANVKTEKEFTDFMMYLKVRSVINGALTIALPNGSGITVSEGKVFGTDVIKSATTERAKELFSSPEFTLCVRAQGNRLTLGYIASDAPIGLLMEPVAEFVTANSTTLGNVTVKAGDGNATLVQSARVYSLDMSIPIETQNYDPALEPELDPVKPEFGEVVNRDAEKKGCGSVVNAESVIFAGLVLATFAIVAVLRKKKGEEK